MTNQRPRKITELGVGHVPEDRHRDGMVLDMTIAENIALQNLLQRAAQQTWIYELQQIK